MRQDDGLVLELATKEFLRRVSVIWSSPLYNHAKAVASNQYALPVLTYLMWTQTWPLAEFQQIDREACKIISGSGGNHSVVLGKKERRERTEVSRGGIQEHQDKSGSQAL